MSARDTPTLDRLAGDLLPACPDCGDLAFPGATVCESCGTHLFVRQGSGRPFEPMVAHPVEGCTCGGQWQCTRCVIYLLDHRLL